MKKFLKLLLSIAICQLAGLAALPFTLSAIPAWYNTLNKPIFTPPGWTFSVVWTTLYLIMGIAFYIIWSKGLKKRQAKEAISIFVLQLFLNFHWSLLFFGLKSPGLALLDIVVLWIAIVLTIRAFLPISKTAGYLLIPYLAWVTFAVVLNISIVILN